MELKQVKSRIIFFDDVTPNGKDHMDVTGTYNITKRDYCDRNPDIEVETQDRERFLIDKAIIAAIREIRVVSQVVEEIERNDAKPGAKYKEVIH